MREPRGAKTVQASPREVERAESAKALIKPDADQIRNGIVKLKKIRSGEEFEGLPGAFTQYLEDRRQQRLVDLCRYTIGSSVFLVLVVVVVTTIGPEALPALAVPTLLRSLLSSLK